MCDVLIAPSVQLYVHFIEPYDTGKKAMTPPLQRGKTEVVAEEGGTDL